MDTHDFSSQGIKDGASLDGILSTLSQAAFIDLQFNRITSVGLRQIVEWLKSRPDTAVCVTGNLLPSTRL